MKAFLPLAALILASSAPIAQARELSDSFRRGKALAQARCAACHGITANSFSPNPEAPPWEDIANRPGTTRATLRTFLRDSHNYPAAMNFRLTVRRVDDISRYMITLQRAGYKPSI